jgi:uncharacterized membrane protein
MPQFCAACGAQMADGATTCPACGRSSAASAGTGAAAAPAVSSSNNGVFALLSYIFWIPAIIFLLIEPYNKDKELRFHCFQALFLGIANIIISTILAITVIGLVILPLVGLAFFIVAIVAGVKAMQGNRMVLPVIGPMAEKQA